MNQSIAITEERLEKVKDLKSRKKNGAKEMRDKNTLQKRKETAKEKNAFGDKCNVLEPRKILTFGEEHTDPSR
jgi:hypothetical protein